MQTGFIAVLIVFAVIVAAVLSKRCTECLLLGSIVGAAVLYGKDFLTQWVEVLMGVVGDNAWLWLVCGLFGSMIAVLTASKGTFGFSKVIGKICNTTRKTMFATYIMGILIFIDDYLNVLSIGTCMKGLYDKRKLPREALAFILDSTGAPVCVLLPVSTWAVFYAQLFMEQTAVSSRFSSPMSAYLSAVPFCFYPIIALIIVALFCAGIFPKLGFMKKAYQRVEETGKVYSDASRKYNMNESNGDEDGNIWNFVIPMLVLVIVSFVTDEILIGVISALALCLVMYVPRKLMSVEEFFNLTVSGFGSMLSIFFLLTACFTLQEITAALGMTDFIIDIAMPYLTPALFPVACFLLLGVLAFATGSDWGMSAVVIPIFIPLAQALGANIVLTMAAIISGGAFGSHACFYADATVLSSQSSGIDNLDHAMSQLPYVGIAAGIASICFFISGNLML
ncbi:MAG: Na+/H+ antiporter NhaC family protein [Lachnospiraceae bacterium]|nr:Na+/H+ antiporter NhaC family protein [Lachnospiraceae bacterium]